MIEMSKQIGGLVACELCGKASPVGLGCCVIAKNKIAELESKCTTWELMCECKDTEIAELIDKGGKQADNSCLKCGSKELNTRYVKSGEHITSSSAKEIETEFLTSSESSYYYSVTSKKEHLHRHCRNCQYDWNEQVLQAKN